MNPRLIGVAGPLQGAVFALPEGEVSIGRDAGNHLFAVDGALSRKHCIIRRAGAACTVRDLQSRNGTLVNGIPVEDRELAQGDQLSVGSSVLMFVDDADAPDQMVFAETAELDLPALRLEAAARLDAILSKLPGSADHTHYLHALLKISTAIGGMRDRESLEWQLLGFLFDLLPADRAAVFHFDKSGEVESSAAWDRTGASNHSLAVGKSVLRRLYEGKVGFIEPAAPVEAGGPPAGARLALCMPMVISRNVMGAIYLEGGTREKPFDQTHLEVLSAVASVAALALENLEHWERLRSENQTLRAEVNLEYSMVGVSARMKEVFDFVRRVAPTDATVLIEGESGTGKELVARAVHRNSRRNQNVFVAINCAAIAENLLESELFGHEKGAFTGATAQKKGKIEIAEGGTLFLDEVGELAPELQAKLLRVLQEKEFERVGGTRPITLDVRLIAATNKRLSQAVDRGEFRKDLYYRLNVVTLAMPALRDRPDDIPQLAEHFLAKVSRKGKAKVKRLSDEAKACLVRYSWPGNVRELENAIERAIVLGEGEAVLPEDLPEAVLESGPGNPQEPAKYLSSVKDAKRQAILSALEQAHGSYLEAAKILGIHPNSLLRLMRNLNLRAAMEAGPPPSREAK